MARNCSLACCSSSGVSNRVNASTAARRWGRAADGSRERRSSVLFMPQYAEPWKHRILQSTLDAIRTYPEFPEGSRTWDERVFHPDANGVIRPLSSLWPKGRAPIAFGWGIAMVQLLGKGPVSGGLRMAWSESSELRLALGDSEG